MPLQAVRDRALGPHTTGVPVYYDAGATLDLALRMRPATRRVVVGEASDYDRYDASLVRATLDGYASRIGIEYLVGLPLADTLAAVRVLPRVQSCSFSPCFATRPECSWAGQRRSSLNAIS